ncbi:MAG: hypothetical protein Fur0021_32730 [Candidatus Promineifilaceae bacterium]
MYVASNGFVSFGAGYTNSGNGAIPNTSTPNNAIYGLWDYLYPLGGYYGAIYTRQISPTLYAVQYNGVTHCCSGSSPETFQILLDGSDNSITLQYQDVNLVSSATVGVENDTGTKATQLSYNQDGIIVDGAAFKLTPATQFITVPSYIQSSVPLVWEEIAPPDDTNVVAIGTNTYTQVNLGFPFDFYGNSYEQMYVASNGFVSFGAGYTNNGNGTIPNTSTPNNAIYGLWDYLYPVAGTANGLIYTRQISPTLYAVQWERVGHCCTGSSPETFQILLDGSDNSVTLQYQDVSLVNSATVGVENDSGLKATQISYNQNGIIVDGAAFKLTPVTQFITIPSYAQSSQPLAWQEIAPSDDTQVVALSNDTYTQVNLGFSFEFYGNSHDQMYVGSNGYVSFGAGYTTSGNSAIPSLGTPNNAIYGLWDDLYPIAGAYGVIYTRQISPSLYAVQWERVTHCCSTTSPETFQILLDGSDNSVTLQYQDVTATSSATVGVENEIGNYATQLVYNQAGVIVDGLAYRLTPYTQAITVPTYLTTTVPITWTDIAPPAGTSVVALADNTFTQVDLGFPFEFYGTPYTQMYVGSNGFVSFGNGYSTSSNGALPNPSTPNNAIYGLWDDLYPIGGNYGQIYTRQISPTLYVVQWEAVTHCCTTTSPETFQIILNGADSTFTLQYQDVTATSSATVGVENINGVKATQTVYNQAGVIVDGLALHFAPIIEEPEPPQICDPQQVQPLNMMLVIDRSGSMSGQAIIDAKAAAVAFVDLMNLDIDRVGLASFASTATLNYPLTQDGEAVKAAINALVASGSTAIGDGLAVGQAALVAGAEPGVAPVMVLLSDGYNNAGQDPINAANVAKAAGTHIVTIGLGSGVDTALMQAIASTPQDFYYAPDSSDLAEIFASIAGGFCRQPLPYVDGCGFVLWEETVPVTTTTSLDVTRMVEPLNVSGRLKLDGRIFAETGQLLDQHQYPFYLYDETTALTLDTDRDIYRPGETIQASGFVTNTSALAQDMVLRLYHDSDLLLSQALSLTPGQGFGYQLTLTATAPLSSTNFNLAATANGRAVFRTVTVSEPQVTAQLDAPAVAGRAPFSATLTLTNTGIVPASVTAIIQNATNSQLFNLIPGQVARLEGSLSITQDTVVTAPLSGDLTTTLTQTVTFGEAATIAVTPQSVYPVGLVNVPYLLTNTGILPTAFDTEFTLQNSGGAVVASLTIPTDLPVGESQAGLLPLGYLPADTYTLAYAMPFASGSVNFVVLIGREAHLTAVAGSAVAATVPVTATVSNTGLETFSGQVALQTAFFAASAPVVDLASGQSVDLLLPVDVSAAAAGDYPAHLRLLDQSGSEVDQADVTLTVPGPDLVLTDLPTNLTLPVSTTVTMTFGVANHGAAAGEGTLSFAFSDYVDEVQRFWLAGGQDGEVNFTFFVPPDIEAKVYPAPYAFNDEPGVLFLNVEGIDIGVTPSLDKAGYYEGETALLTLHISELADRATVPLYALVRFNEYSERQPFSLPALGSTNLTFSVPVSFLGDEKVFYGIYGEASDTSIHLNTLYLPQLYPDVTVLTDKQVYEPGETVLATVVTTATGQLDVVAPGFAGIIPLPGHDTTFSFTLPQTIARGTYSIDYVPQNCNCLHESETLRTPFDVAAPEVRVVNAYLETPACETGAPNLLHLDIASNEAVTGLLRVWLEQPNGAQSLLAEQTISVAALPANMFTVPFTPVSDQSGVHRVRYEMLHLAAADLFYAVGAEACDAGQSIVVDVVTDKPSYNDGETVLATVTLFALQPGLGDLTLAVDGGLASSQAVALNGGYQTVTVDLGAAFAAGDHDVQATLAQAGLHSAADTRFAYGADLPDLAISPPFVLRNGTLERNADLFVVNAGSTAAPATTVDLYLGHPDNGGQLVGTAAVPSLDPGQSYTARIGYSVAGVTDLTYILVARVDPTNAIAERREDNNQAQTETRMPPTVEVGPDQTIVEGGTVSLSGAYFTGPDPLDSYTANLFWEYQDEIISPTVPMITISGTLALMTGSYTYLDDNPYPVSITVCDSSGMCAQDTFLVTVLNLPPLVEAGPDQTVDAGAVVGLAPATFTDAGIYDVHAALVNWGDGTIGEGIVNEMNGAGSVAATHIYITGNTYTVTVEVCDDDSDCHDDFFLVTVTGNIGNSDPVALPDTAATTESAPVDVDVLANDSDEDGDELMVIEVTTPAHGSAAVNPDKTIQYTPGPGFVGSDSFEYTISDGQGGLASAAVTVTVYNVPPVVDAGPDVVIYEGQWLQSVGVFTDPGQNEWTGTVDYGDGDGSEPLPLNPDKQFDLSHPYLDVGVYTVTVTVADNHGGVGSDTLQVTVVHGFAQFCLFSDSEHGLHIHQDSVVDCNVGSAEKVEIKQDAVINGYIFSYNDKVDVSQEAQIYGDITAFGDVTLHQDGLVTGSLFSGDDIDLKQDSTVQGDATAHDDVKLAQGAVVNGVITENGPLPVIPPLTLVQVTVNAGTTDVTVPKNQTVSLQPGAYRNLKVEEGATLILFAGEYAFETINVYQNATVHFDLSGGSQTIVVGVKKDIDVQQDVQMTTNGQARHILFRVQSGHIHLHQDGVYLGTFLTVGGHIELHQDSVLTGALFGHQVDVKQESHVIGEPALDLLIDLFIP